MDELEYSVERCFDLPGGGSIKVKVSSAKPIDEAGLLILRPGAAVAAAESLVGMANAFKAEGSA
jgi:hypothetical protein